MKSALSVLLLCFLLASCGEEKTVKVESKEAKETRVRAEAGDARAQFELAAMYHFGVPQNYVEAMKWYRKAAEQGLAEAQSNLGMMYYHGEGVPKDYVEAAKCYRKAAEQGLAFAQFNLGWIYENGEGVPKDMAEATKWYRKAAEQGDADAMEWLEKNAKENGE